MPEEAPLIFISYSHDSLAHRDKVLAFADRLRDEGIDAHLDLYVQFPPEGWNSHCAREIRRADRVLIVCTEIYRRRWEEEKEPGRGNGVRSEANLIRNYFYQAGSETQKFVPILLDGATEAHIPDELKSLGRYRVEIVEEYEQLYRLLTGQHDTPAFPLGKRRVLKSRVRPSFGQSTAASPIVSAALIEDPVGASSHTDTNKRNQPDLRAQNYERVDIVSSEPEVLIDPPRDGYERGVYVRVDSIERLYVQGQKARIEFGVRQAFITVDNDGPGSLYPSAFLCTVTTRRNARFINLHDAPHAVSVCVDPDPGKTSLAELALPLPPHENYLCQIAWATADVETTSTRAELRISLDVKGLFLLDEVGSQISASTKKQIEAIVAIAIMKYHHQIENRVIRRELPVRDRKR